MNKISDAFKSFFHAQMITAALLIVHFMHEKSQGYELYSDT